jgi:hypothetical protein
MLPSSARGSTGGLGSARPALDERRLQRSAAECPRQRFDLTAVTIGDTVWFMDDTMDREDDFDQGFADPGGKSALRSGVRILPCPTCKQPNRLTRRDRDLGYQCDPCADRDEGGGP